MRRLCLSVVLFFLFFTLSFTEIKAQGLEIGCSRTTIESYSGNEKKPVLRYLDEARKVTDEFMWLFAEQKYDEIYKLHKDMKIWVVRNPKERADEMSLDAVVQEYGQITKYEYRNQIVLHYINSPIELKGTTVTFYAVKTTKSESNNLYISVVTDKYRVEDNAYLSSAHFEERDSDKNPVSDYISPLSKTCNGMEKGLRVKIPLQ